jgi:GPR1/FUN34/yaaH family
MLWILTFKLNKTLCSLFGLLGITCFLLSFGVHYESVDIVGGYFGIITSFNAFWLAFAELVNDVIGEGKEVIPLGHWNLDATGVGGAHAPGRIQPMNPSVVVQPVDHHVKVEKVSRTPMLESLEEDLSDDMVFSRSVLIWTRICSNAIFYGSSEQMFFSNHIHRNQKQVLINSYCVNQVAVSLRWRLYHCFYHSH